MIDGLKARIAELLANGVRPAQVSRALSVSEGYISGLLSGDDEFKAHLGELVARTMEQEVTVKAGYRDVEEGALHQMVTLIPNADMRELSLALEAVNKNKQRQGLAGGGGDGGGSVNVTLELPRHAVESITIEVNARNEITKVGDKGMMSLTAAQFSDKLRESDGKEACYADSETAEVNGIGETGSSARQAISQRFAEIERVTGGLQ